MARGQNTRLRVCGNDFNERGSKMLMTTEEIQHDFFRWLDDDQPLLTLPHYQTALTNSAEPLPERLCESIGVPIGSSIGHALRCMIPLFIDGQECRMETIVHFDSEERSLHWWNATKDVQRWSLEHQPNGGAKLSIAGAPEDISS